MEKLIRRLGAQDAGAAERVLFSFKGWSRPQRALQEFLSNSANYLLIAESGGEAAGFLMAYRLERPDRLPCQMFIYEIEVAPPCRGQGVGTALVQAIKTLARDEGMFEAFVLTSRKNVAARKLFKRTGGTVEDDDAMLFVYPFGPQDVVSR